MVLALCFGFGAALAAVAGNLISLCYPVNTVMGLEYTIIATIVVVLGGLGSIPQLRRRPGPRPHRQHRKLLRAGLALVAYYAIFVLLLLVRPTGIMGR